MSDTSGLPPVDEYPGYFANKPPFLKRKTVQVVGTGLAGVLLGAVMGGSGTASNASVSNGIPEYEVQSRIAAAVERQLDDAVNDAVDESQNAAAEDLEQTKAELQSVRQALVDAKNEVRNTKKAAQRAQRKAVAAAVAKTEERLERQGTSEPRSFAGSAGSASATDPRFTYCYEANDAGYGNYQSGVDPEYDWYDDADNDGWVCEF